MPNRIPVVFLAFANEKQSEVRYLRGLAKEQASLKAALEPAIAAGLCEVVVESNATVKSILNTFQKERFRDRIAIFHYGGHADGYRLLLESLEGDNVVAHGAGLVSFFSKQSSLRLVFLNGCSTQQQAEELVDAGVPAVIGTSQSIADDVATQLAARFYQSIGQGGSLERAWAEAEDEVKIRYSESPMRDAEFVHDETGATVSTDLFPWRMYYRPGAEIVQHWNLPEAVGNPLFGLPELSGAYDLPERPFRFLHRFERRHAELFFGRGAYIREVYQRLTDPHSAPVLLLHGQSGVGKSSLLEAGVLPRLEASHETLYLRRNAETGLTRTLADVFDQQGTIDAAALKAAWLDREQKSERPVVLILDQVEEAFTRPIEGKANELANFLQIVQAIVDDPQDRPTGRLVLSYRKEFHPEIEEQCRQLEIPREKIFISKLSRADIIEVVKGLTSTERLRRRYGLQVEETLPAVIADDLLADPNSAIAPVLQILLTKLWELNEGEDAPHFTVENYNELRKAGILLDDFFAEQMGQLQTWMPEVVDSGLALDLLHWHTTSMATATSRDLEEIRRLYEHREELLEPLLSRFKGLYLLTEAGQAKTGLAHDALAPIVQRETKDSDKPGQRALRILTSKMPEYELQPDKVYIDEEDLILVEKGAAGMRLWTLKERELVEKSRARRTELEDERRRNRYLKIGGVLVIALLGIAAAFFGLQSSMQAEINDLVGQALQLEKTDPTQALVKAQAAWEQAEQAWLPVDDNMAVSARHDIHADHEFYEYVLPHPASVNSVVISKEGDYILSTSGKMAWLWAPAQSTEKAIDSLEHPMEVRQALFSLDESAIFTIGNDSLIRMWNKEGQLIKPLQGHTTYVEAIAIMPGSGLLASGDQSGKIILWSPQGDLLGEKETNEDFLDITSLTFSLTANQLVSGDEEGNVKMWSVEGDGLQLVDSIVTDDAILSLAADPLSQGYLLGAEGNLAHVFSIEDRSLLPLRGHNRALHSVQYSPDGQYLLSGSEDRTIRLWDRKRNSLKVYEGHQDWVHDLAFLPDGSSFASASADSTIRVWRLRSKELQQLEHEDGQVSGVSFLKDGRILTALIAKEIDYSTISYEEFLWLEDNPPVMSAYIWSKNGQDPIKLNEHDGDITAVACSPDGTSLLTGGTDSKLILWDTTGKLVKTVGHHEKEIVSLSFSPTEAIIASGSKDSTVILWNISGGSIDTFPHPSEVSSVTFSPDGRSILTGCFDGFARLWTRNGELLQTFETPNAGVKSVRFSSDGQTIAVGAAGNGAGLYLWQLDSTLIWAKQINFDDQNGNRSINSIHFSPDGSNVAIGADGGIVKIFDVIGREIQTFNDFSGTTVYEVVFSADGQTLLVGSGDGKAHLFPVFRNK